MILHWFRRHFRPAIAILVLMIVSIGPGLVSRMAGNIGLVSLLPVLLPEAGAPRPRSSDVDRLVQAEQWLNFAINVDPAHRGAWRGLGMIFKARHEEVPPAIWISGGMTAKDLLGRGHVSYSAGLYEEASIWFEQATQLAPDEGDGWYYLGLAYEGLGSWEQALSAFQRGLYSWPLTQIGASDFLYHVSWLQYRHVEPPAPQSALETIDLAIDRDQYVQERLRAESHFLRGDILSELGFDERAMRDYEWVVQRHPEHYGALVGLGTVVWRSKGDFLQAEVYLKQAIDLMPQSKWAYRQLGLVYQKMGRYGEAVVMYQRVLSIDSQDALAIEQLKNLDALESH